MCNACTSWCTRYVFCEMHKIPAVKQWQKYFLHNTWKIVVSHVTQHAHTKCVLWHCLGCVRVSRVVKCDTRGTVCAHRVFCVHRVCTPKSAVNLPRCTRCTNFVCKLCTLGKRHCTWRELRNCVIWRVFVFTNLTNFVFSGVLNFVSQMGVFWGVKMEWAAELCF